MRADVFGGREDRGRASTGQLGVVAVAPRDADRMEAVRKRRTDVFAAVADQGRTRRDQAARGQLVGEEHGLVVLARVERRADHALELRCESLVREDSLGVHARLSGRDHEARVGGPKRRDQVAHAVVDAILGPPARRVVRAEVDDRGLHEREVVGREQAREVAAQRRTDAAAQLGVGRHRCTHRRKRVAIGIRKPFEGVDDRAVEVEEDDRRAGGAHVHP